MVIFPNTDITVYNRYYDKVNALDKYQRTVITKVNWTSTEKLIIGDKGGYSEDITLIIMDILSNYIKPKQFKKLSDIDRVNYFTLAVGDRIVKGNISFEVTNIADLDKNFDDVITITGARPLTNHWEIEGE